MNWEIIATLSEVIAASGVIASLIYVARQLHASQTTAADTNRLNRSRGVCDMMLTLATDDDFRRSFVKTNGLEPYFEQMASDLNVSAEDAARSDFGHAYWFWLHWGQYSSTTDAKDIEDLKLVIYPYAAPGMNYSWENSIVAKPCLDPAFVEFVDSTLSKYLKETE